VVVASSSAAAFAVVDTVVASVGAVVVGNVGAVVVIVVDIVGFVLSPSSVVVAGASWIASWIASSHLGVVAVIVFRIVPLLFLLWWTAVLLTTESESSSYGVPATTLLAHFSEHIMEHLRQPHEVLYA